MEEKNETGPAVEPRPEQQCKQARPHDELIAELLDSRRLKTEREHAAAREIERLRAALAAAGDLLFDLWDGDAEMLARYETVNNQITRALKVGAGDTAVQGDMLLPANA